MWFLLITLCWLRDKVILGFKVKILSPAVLELISSIFCTWGCRMLIPSPSWAGTRSQVFWERWQWVVCTHHQCSVCMVIRQPAELSWGDLVSGVMSGVWGGKLIFTHTWVTLTEPRSYLQTHIECFIIMWSTKMKIRNRRLDLDCARFIFDVWLKVKAVVYKLKLWDGLGH